MIKGWECILRKWSRDLPSPHTPPLGSWDWRAAERRSRESADSCLSLTGHCLRALSLACDREATRREDIPGCERLWDFPRVCRTLSRCRLECLCHSATAVLSFSRAVPAPSRFPCPLAIPLLSQGQARHPVQFGSILPASGVPHTWSCFQVC